MGCFTSRMGVKMNYYVYSLGHRQKLCVLKPLQEFEEILNEKIKWPNSRVPSKNKDMKDYFKKTKTVLLKYNLHSTKSTQFKCIIQRLLVH